MLLFLLQPQSPYIFYPIKKGRAPKCSTIHNTSRSLLFASKFWIRLEARLDDVGAFVFFHCRYTFPHDHLEQEPRSIADSE